MSSGCSLEARCNRGDGVACGVLGDRAYHGAKEREAFTRACDYYRKGCAAENFAACASLGALLGRHKCTGPQGEAAAALQRACDHQDMAGCNNLGMLFRDGADGQTRDTEKAITLFDKACPHAATACDNLGSLLIDTDEARASAAFQRGCDANATDDGQAGSCYKLGLSYENGWGVPADKDKARSLYAPACARGVADSCYRLGLHELDGGPEQLILAADHFRRACDMGVAGGCNNMGLMYAAGKGVAADQRKAVDYLQRGCDGGELRACANLGSRYFLGDGAPLDRAKGEALLSKACAGGVAEGCVRPTPARP